MHSDTALTFFWLHILNRRRYDALVSECGDLDTAAKHLSVELLRSIGLRQETAVATMVKLQSFDPHQYADELQKHGVGLLSLEDNTYPKQLQEIADLPMFLSYKGDVDLLSQPMVGVVGTRAMSSYGKRVVETFVPHLARSGLVTVSGLALGIDAMVARETMNANRPTVAVLGSGLKRVTPPGNTKLSKELVDAGGLLLSEYPLDMQSDLYTYPARNRIIAGLSMATIVCEAPMGSGAVITAELAFDYGREVFAVPNMIFDSNAAGCHELIRRGQAQIATDPADVLRELGIMGGSSAEELHFSPQTDDEQVVYKWLSGLPQTVDELASKAGLETSRIGVALTFMELVGAAKNTGRGQWVRG